MAPTGFSLALSALSLALPVVSGASLEYDSMCISSTTTLYEYATFGAMGSKPSAAPVKSSPSDSSGQAKAVGSKTVSQQYAPPSDISYPGVTFPVYSPQSPNPNGPLYNPNNYVPQPVSWPGYPKGGQVAAPAFPKHNSNPGGTNKDLFQAPSWCKKGSDLKPALSQSDTNGNSVWGLIDCPHLAPYLGLDNSSVTASVTSSGSLAHATTSSAGSSSSSKSSSSPSFSFGSPANVSISSVPSGTGIPSSLAIPTSLSVPSSLSFPSFNSSITGFLNNTNLFNGTACGKMPESSRVRHYDLSVGYAVIAPDGVQKNGLVVNGGFPGPLIEANWGEWIEITVTNNLPDEGTSLHWHGLLQEGTPWFDGVPSVSQAPIAPGESLTYKFRADHFGTTWYHSHYSAQYSGGALGPLVIHGPKTEPYDIDIGPVMLADWYHKDYFSIVNDTMNGFVPLSNNVLINGKMNYPCENTTFVCTPNAGISKFAFKSGKKHLLRLINPSAEAIMKFTIDGHNLKVIANDFVAINPYETNVVTLGVGQRSDVIISALNWAPHVEAVGSSGDAYWMRAEMGNGFDTTNPGCSFSDGISIQATAAVYYEDADTDSLPSTTASWTTAQLQYCGNDALSLTTPLCKIPLVTPATTETIDITFGSNGTNFVWFMNNSTFRADFNHALISAVNNGNMTFEDEWNVHNFGSNDSVRLILHNHFITAHPIHLHGHDYHVLAEGVGEWDGTITNPENTQRRDVQLMQPGLLDGTASYIVIQWNQDNPGVWPLHCHIAWHVSAGLYINVLERPDDIQKMTVPREIKNGENTWNSYSNSVVVNQIDSGL
ncbi:hypothetical protein EG327_011206 [Venturia inaequalis]|uniref:Multicopper oxidase n=1 Tax=Venturia inaequalis TaxID=5025 RepID=A0A8H3VPZ5_VENIN|nr:hypothetical protein EG327_011206 [Venturia inaequalis]